MNLIQRGNAWLDQRLIQKINPRLLYIGAIAATGGGALWQWYLGPQYAYVGTLGAGVGTAYVVARVIAYREAHHKEPAE